MRISFFTTGTVLLALGCGAAGFWQGKTERHETAAAHLKEDLVKPANLPRPETGSVENAAAAFARRLEKADAAALPELYEELRQLAQGEDRQTRLELLFARWAELDPAGGLVFFREKNDANGRARLLLEWALLDTDAPGGGAAAGGGRKVVDFKTKSDPRVDPGSAFRV